MNNKIDRLTLFLGKPFKVTHEIFLYSPTIQEIEEIGENLYSFYLHLCSFNARKILIDLYGVDEDEVDEMEEKISEKDQYFILCSNPYIYNEICNALSFFLKQNVVFNESDYSFRVKDQIIVDNNLYLLMSEWIKEINGLQIEEEKKEKKPKLKIPKASLDLFKNMKKEQKKQEEKLKDKKGLRLKDMLSILCNFSGNGIDIFNVGTLTIYQVYEQFERMGLKESHQRILPVWANGNLGEKGKITEWLVPTKL